MAPGRRRPRARQARCRTGLAERAGSSRHRHRLRRGAVPCISARLPGADRGYRLGEEDQMGIRDNRYVVDVPTVTAPVRRRGLVHGEQVRFTRAYTERQLKFTLPGPMTICDTIADAHYGRRADMAMAFAAILNEEARELEAAGSTSSSSMSRRSTCSWTTSRTGARCPAPRDRGPALPDRRPYLLRLRHRSQHPLEADAWRRMAPVRGDLPGAECQSPRPGVAGVRQLAGAAVAARSTQGRQILLGAIDVATHEDDTGTGRCRDPRRVRLRRPRTDPAVHQLRHGAVAAGGRRRQAQGARGRRDAGARKTWTDDRLRRMHR